jgi:hypothetical protein
MSKLDGRCDDPHKDYQRNKPTGKASPGSIAERLCQFVHKSGIVCLRDIVSPIHAANGHHLFVSEQPAPAQSVAPRCPDCLSDDPDDPGDVPDGMDSMFDHVCTNTWHKRPAVVEQPAPQRAEQFLCREENKTGMARTSRWTWESACQFAEAYAARQLAKRHEFEDSYEELQARAEAAETLVGQLRELLKVADDEVSHWEGELRKLEGGNAK